MRFTLLFPTALLSAVSPATAAPSSAGPDALRAAALAQLGAEPRLTAGIAIPDCPAGFRLHRADPAAPVAQASCPGTPWQTTLLLAGSPQAAAMPRRGQGVRAAIDGHGYKLSVDAIVETADAASATLVLRNSRSGNRFTARIAPDGRILATLP